MATFVCLTHIVYAFLFIANFKSNWMAEVRKKTDDDRIQ